MFWDTLSGKEYLRQIENEDSSMFRSFHQEWTKHLLKQKVRVWAETTLSNWILEEDAL